MTDAGEAAAPAEGHIRDNWRECPQCGLICALPGHRPALAADCPRCDHTLWRTRSGRQFQFPVACGLAALLFYLFALVAPFLEISAYGRFQLASLTTGPIQLTSQGFASMGILVFCASILMPGVKLAIMLLTLLGLDTGLLPKPLLKRLFRWYDAVSPWAMIDVYLLGFLVAYTRLSVLADVHLDTALFSLIGFMVSTAAADGALDREAVWHALDESPPAPPRADGVMISCAGCGLLDQAEEGERCRRCESVLHVRKTGSIGRSWAFLISAAMLYIPANIYPVMTIISLARTQDVTIMAGIVELANYGLWPLALLVFFASITIPLMKLLILIYLLVQTQRGHAEHLLGRTRAYRFIEFIGRWSMIDVFMISILVALVRFGQFSAVNAQLGAPCFAAVVVLTMFAANSFDPRLMWDAASDAEPDATAPLRAGQPVPGLLA